MLVTERCNARCLHCDIWKNRGGEESLTLEQWQTVLSDLRSWLGPVHIVMTGGEALLKPYTIDIVAHGASIGLFIELLSHGYWKDPSRIERLALANPWRITISLDGVGETHSRIRGIDDFFERTDASIETLKRVRKENNLDFSIRLKTVVMSHNLDNLGEVARYATQDGMDVLYQAIEQNYNTLEDPEWYRDTDNWPTDTQKAIGTIENLIKLKQEGCSIANSLGELEGMVGYFRDHEAWQASHQAHTNIERCANCSALGLLQVQSNGDVTVCCRKDTIGNVKSTSAREIWQGRPRWWEGKCCLEPSPSNAEQQELQVLHFTP